MTEQQAGRTSQPDEVYRSFRNLQLRLQRLEHRESFLWWAGVVVMLLLTTAVVSFSLPGLIRDPNPAFQFQLGQAVRALIGLVLIFNTYTIYQQVLIKRLRRQLTEQMTETSELRSRADEFYTLAVHDHLTGLYNRRFTDERLSMEIARSQRHSQPLTVMALDLDDFKRMNDVYGHAAGDQILREFATRLRKAIRTTDLAARTGGDEFMVLLLECPPANAQILLHRLRPMDIELDDGRKLSLNVSAGWAGFQLGDTAESLLARADQALYDYKRQAKTPTAKAHIAN